MEPRGGLIRTLTIVSSLALLGACTRPVSPRSQMDPPVEATLSVPTCPDGDGPLFPFAIEVPEDRFTTECGTALLPDTRQAWGYITRSGCVEIPPTFEAARPFVGDRAVVTVAEIIESEHQWGIVGTFGAIDRSGALTVPADYLDLTDFHGGIATALVSEVLPDRGFASTVGTFLDGDGNRLGPADCGIQVNPNVRNCDDQSEGLSFTKPSLSRSGWREVIGEERLQAVIGDLGQIEDAVRGLIDSDMVFSSSATPGQYVTVSGELAFEGWFDYGDAFSEGLAAAKALGGSGLGYIDASGQFAIEPRFQSAGPFRDGLAVVRRDGQREVIRTDGTVAFTTEERISGDFEGGYLTFYRLTDDGYRYGLLDKNGAIALEPVHPELGRPSDGLVAIPAEKKFGQPQWRFIATDGRDIGPLADVRVGGYTSPAFSQGLARAIDVTLLDEGTHGEWVDGKYQEVPGTILESDGYLGTDGAWVVDPTFRWNTAVGMLWTGRALCDSHLEAPEP